MAEHIKVELDFVPVEERLPDEAGEYQVLGATMVIEYDVFDPEFIGSKWSCGDDRWSHWALCPQITRTDVDGSHGYV